MVARFPIIILLVLIAIRIPSAKADYNCGRLEGNLADKKISAADSIIVGKINKEIISGIFRKKMRIPNDTSQPSIYRFEYSLLEIAIISQLKGPSIKSPVLIFQYRQCEQCLKHYFSKDDAEHVYFIKGGDVSDSFNRTARLTLPYNMQKFDFSIGDCEEYFYSSRIKDEIAKRIK